MIERYLINRRYARLWAGQATSLIGDAIFDTTLVLWIASHLAVRNGVRAAWAPGAVGVLTAVIGAAVLLVGPLSGVFVDRWNKRTTMLRTEALRLVIAGGLAALAFLPVRTLPVGVWLALIYVVVFVLNGAGQFFSQSRFVVVRETVESPEDLARAGRIGMTTNSVAAIVGPPLAAPLFISVGLPWALLFNAITYAVSYAMIRSAGLSTGPVESSGRGVKALRAEYREGLRQFAANRFMRRVLTGFAISTAGAGALASLMYFFLTTNLHSSGKLLGVVEACFGAGGVIGALLSGRIVKVFGGRAAIWFGMMACGVLLEVLARQTEFAAGAVLFAAISLPTIAYNAALSPMFYAHVPKEYLGRIMAVFNPALQAISMASGLICGWLASTALRKFHTHVAGIAIGPYDLLFTIAGLLIIVAAIYMMIMLPRGDGPVPVPPPRVPEASTGSLSGRSGASR